LRKHFEVANDREKERLMLDLLIRANAKRTVNQEAFGAEVSESDRSLDVPELVVSFAQQNRITNASGLLGYVRAFPTIVVTAWGLSPDDVKTKTGQLAAKLAGHVATELLAEPERRPVAYGAWVPTRPVLPKT